MFGAFQTVGALFIGIFRLGYLLVDIYNRIGKHRRKK